MISLTQISKQLVLKIFAKAQEGNLVLWTAKQGPYQFGKSNFLGKIHLHVHDESFFRDLILLNDIGLGESYEAGKWDTNDLTGLIRWLLINKSNFESTHNHLIKKVGSTIRGTIEGFRHYKRRNSKSQSRKNIQLHYDLGNTFYQNFLDTGMTYSSAFFTSEDQSLQDAQFEKYERICQKLNLRKDLHILEIGTGWGGFAVHAATNHGCKVTTTTISKQQFEFAFEKIRELGLKDQIELKLEDYRNLTGKYDRVVSIEMLEAVGHQFLKTYFQKCYDLLKNNGLAAYQVILASNHEYNGYRKRVDWIRKHIFPGGHLPSLNSISSVLEKSDIPWEIYHCETFGTHYARTLREWRDRYNDALYELDKLGFNDAFHRKWNFYLSFCEAGFLQRHINVAQIIFGRPDIETFEFECASPPLGIDYRLDILPAPIAS